MRSKLVMISEVEEHIYAPLPERNVCKVGNKRRTMKEFKLSLELGGYEMKDVMLDVGSDVNIIPKKS